MSGNAAEQAAQRRRDRRLLGLVALALVLALVGGGLALQNWRTSRSPAAVPTTSASRAPVEVAAGKPLVFGQPAARVRLAIYEDFHCPHCADFDEELGPTLTAEQEAGRLAVELYPMSFIDAGSAAAANAVACAAESGFGPAYYRGLFANHTLKWSDSQLTELAGQVTTEVPPTFASCVTNRSHASWVESINATAQAKGVTETPTVFLDGRKLDWSTLTPDSLRSMIDQAAG